MIVCVIYLSNTQFCIFFFFFFSSRRRHTRFSRDWSSDVCSSDLSRPTQNRISMNVFAPVYPRFARSEEHTSELQSRENLVCRLLLEKKKKNQKHILAIKKKKKKKKKSIKRTNK